MDEYDMRWAREYDDTIQSTLDRLAGVCINGRAIDRHEIQRLDDDMFELWMSGEVEEKIL